MIGRVLLAAALLFTVLVSGSDSGRLVTPVRLVGSVIGAVLIIHYLRAAPRRHDRVDLLVLGGLLLFVLTCMLSSLPRLSFEAATTALAYVAAFYVARDVARDEAGRSVTMAVLGLLGTAVAITVLIPWGVVWIQWLSVPGAGAPPFDLALPSTQFYPVSAAMLVGFLLPATLTLARRPSIWPVGVAGVAAAVAVIFMSGSRSLWVAVVLGLAVFWLSEARWRLRVNRWALIGAVVLGLAVVVAVMPQLAGRILTGSSVDLRLAVWSESLGASLDSPLFGYGPGSYASVLVQRGFYNSHATYIDHGHSLPVQLLVESGAVGVLGVALVAGAVLGGARRDLTGWSAAIGAMTMFVVLSLTADPAADAFFVVPLLVWAAVLAPRTVSARVQRPHRSLQVATIAAAAGVAIATGATLAAAWARDAAAVDQTAGHPSGAVAELSSAVRFDPSNALYRRELGVLLMAAGDASAAVEQLEMAVDLHPADVAAWRALAVARLANGDDVGAIEAAETALSRADLHAMNGLTVAFVGAEAGRPEVMQHGMVRALRVAPWLLAAPEWATVFPQTSDTEVLDSARGSWGDSDAASSRNERARAWLAGIADTEPHPDVSPTAAAEAAVLRCRPDLAAAALAQLSATDATSQASLQAQLMLDRAFGIESRPGVATMMAAHDRDLWRRAFAGVAGQSPFFDYFADVTVYGSAPMVPRDGPIFPTDASGLSAWLRDPIAAADIGASSSALARCR